LESRISFYLFNSLIVYRVLCFICCNCISRHNNKCICN